MRATTLLRPLLGFPKIALRDAVLNEFGELVVDVAVRGRAQCPTCGRQCPIHQTRGPRRWRHLDVFGWRCYLRGEVRRVLCRRCGKVQGEAVSWAEPGSGFTRPFEDQVGYLSQRCDKTTISTLMRIAWRTVGAILERVVERHREPVDFSRLCAISIDELSYRKGHRYLTLVTDLDSNRIIWSGDGRTKETLASFFEWLGPEVCKQITHAAIDMSVPYRHGLERHLPHAQIVYDRFHVQQLVSRALDDTRREEWRTHQGTPWGHTIKGTRWAVLKSPWNLTPEQGKALSTLQKQNKRLYRAYLLKESFADIYRRLLPVGWAARRIHKWLSWASRSKLLPFVKVARSIRRHLDGILAYFKTGYTTSQSEGLNTKARLATRQAFGFHGVDAVRAMIELRCTGLLIPLPHQP